MSAGLPCSADEALISFSSVSANFVALSASPMARCRWRSASSPFELDLLLLFLRSLPLCKRFLLFHLQSEEADSRDNGNCRDAQTDRGGSQHSQSIAPDEPGGAVEYTRGGGGNGFAQEVPFNISSKLTGGFIAP